MKTQLFAPEINAFAKNLQSGKEYVNSDIYNSDLTKFDHYKPFSIWLLEKITNETNKLKQDENAYNI